MTDLDTKIDKAHKYLYDNHESYRTNHEEIKDLSFNAGIGTPVTPEAKERIKELNFNNRNLLIDYLESLYE